MKSDMPLVDERERQKAAEDIDNSYCVEAGAGTGKTTLLVNRFLSIIGRGKARCGQIVAITFTEKAASEMKFRLRTKIDELLGAEDCGSAERERFLAARNELERAPISTIHSFAASILKEYALDAGIDPGFSVLDAVDSSLLIDESWSDFLHGIEEHRSEILRRFISLGGNAEHFRKFGIELYYRRGERFVEGIFYNNKTKHNGDRRARNSSIPIDSREMILYLARAFEEAAGTLTELKREHCINPDDLGGREIEGLASAVEIVRQLEGEELEDFLLTFSLPKKAGNKKNWSPPDTCTRQKEIVSELRELFSSQRKRYTDWLSSELVRLLDVFLTCVEKRKNTESALDFDDLLIRTRILLRSESVRRVLRRRFKYVLVDEFQDTDSLQAEIILLLSGGPEDTGSVDPEPGKLFIVGDPKQSIYRFRRADVEVYERIKEWFSKTGRHVKITQNFRSVPPILDWVNESFSEIIVPPDDGRYQPEYEPIHPIRLGSDPAVALLDLETEDSEIKSDDVRRLEGKAIARLIRHLIREQRPVMDTVSREVRPLKPGDIAVIYPGTTGINFYEDPLRNEGIPYIVEGGKLYYTRQEIRDLASVLWAIEDPYDSLALFASLRSPLFGFSDEEIFLFTRGAGRLDYLRPGSPDRRKYGALLDCLALLADLHRGRNERGSTGTLQELLRKTHFVEITVLRPHGEQRVLNIQKAIQAARDFDARISTFRRFARWFKDQEMLAVSEGESPLVEEDENTVRLLTVHKSKGLQFPVVILANLVQQSRHGASIFIEHGDRLVFRIGKVLETSDYRKVSESEKRKERAEIVRLLYVAATRAGDLLVIPRTPVTGGYYDILSNHLPSDGDIRENNSGIREAGPENAGVEIARLSLSDLPRLRGAAKPFVTVPKRSKKEGEYSSRRKEWLSSRRRLLETGTRAPLVVTPSGVERSLPAEKSRPAGMDIPGETGRGDERYRFGLAFHRIMELVEFDSRARCHDLVELDSRVRCRGLVEAVAIELGLRHETNELADLVEQALASSFFRKLSGASRVFREVPFAFPVSGGTLEGRIDLLFELGSAWTAVDYKTDRIAGDEVDERFEVYRMQGGLYALALSRLGVPCSGGVVFYFVRPDETRTLEVTDALLRDAERLIGEALS